MGRVDGLHALSVSRLTIRIIHTGLRIIFAPLNDKGIVRRQLRLELRILCNSLAFDLCPGTRDSGCDSVLAFQSANVLLPGVIPPLEGKAGDGYTEI
jgi:hypothetical protein